MRKFLCWLGFHKYYCKTYSLIDGRTLFNGEFECKYCGKIEGVK